MDGNGFQVGDSRSGSPSCSTPWPGAMPVPVAAARDGALGAKSHWANPGIDPGNVGALLAARPSRNGLAKS